MTLYTSVLQNFEVTAVEFFTACCATRKAAYKFSGLKKGR